MSILNRLGATILKRSKKGEQEKTDKFLFVPGIWMIKHDMKDMKGNILCLTTNRILLQNIKYELYPKYLFYESMNDFSVDCH